MKKTILFIALIALAACASQKMLMPTDADVTIGSAKYPGMTMADLTEGHELYKMHCQKCHALKNPEKYSEAQLDKIVPSMAAKAKIDKATEDKIHRYMVTLSQRPKDAN